MGDSFTGWSGYGPGPDQNVTIGSNALNYEGAVYEDSIFSDIPIVGPIIDWIEAQLTALYNWLTSQFWSIVNPIKDAVTAALGVVLAPISSVLTWVQNKLLDAYHYLSSVIPAAVETVRATVVTISSWVTTAIPNSLTWIRDHVSSIITDVAKIPGWISNAASSVVNSIAGTLKSFFDPIWSHINGAFTSARSAIGPGLSGFGKTVTGIIESIWPPGLSLWDHVQMGVKFLIYLPKMFLEALSYVFVTDIGQTPTQAAKMLQSDVKIVKDTTQGLPAFIETNVADPILDGIKFLFEKLAEILKAAFDLVWKGLTEFFTVILPGIFRTLWDGLHTAVSWVWDKVSNVADFFLDEVVKLVSIHSPITPEGGMGTLKGMVKVGLAMAGGLGIMTVLGNLVHPIHSLGLEHISAMIYDMTNYKLLIGAGMGVIAACAIRIPLTHYFNDILRPNLPGEREVTEMLHRELIDRPTFNKFMAYRGYPDMWHDALAKVTEVPIRYFTLAAIAKAGFYDQAFFEVQLVRSGYDLDTRAALQRMFQTTYSDVIKGLMSGTAIKRFKEGMSTESQFLSELKLLGYTDQQFTQYLAAAKLDYAYDYLTDMIAAYKDAAAKGQISLDDFRGALRGIGIVPDRIEAYVLRIRARLDPIGPLKPIGPPKPEYQTEAGQVKVDTLRRHRQKEMITRGEEIAGLQQLGAPIDYATAVADNDDARLSAAAVTEVGPPKPLYETDAGKITVDTIRRQRRKGLITRDDEVAGLMELEMTELYATAIADNDDARLAEKGAWE
jgi:hypothetical protein